MSEKEGCTQGLVNYTTIWHFWHLWQELLLRWRVLCSTRTCWPCWRACSAVAWSLPLLPSAGRATSTACLASEPLSTFHQLILPKIRKSQGLNSCRICKQTFVDAPNQALEKMVGMIGLPCKYGARGCSELVFLPSRLQHETLCRSQKNLRTTTTKKDNNNRKQ